MTARCPFCEATIAESSFAEHERFVAIYNIAPIVPGHCLVIPRHHVETAGELSDSDLGEAFVFARRVSNFVCEVFGGTGFNWTLQDGAPAGQTVDHLHIHVIPRQAGDFADPGDWYPTLERSRRGELDSQLRPRLEREQICEIAAHLRGLWGGRDF